MAGAVLPTATAAQVLTTPTIAAPAQTMTATLTLVCTLPAQPTAISLPTATSTPTATVLPPPLTPDGQARTATVPILMYHYVSDPPAGADAIRRDLSVRPSDLEAHLAYLKAAGYTSITLEGLLRHLTCGEPLPAKPIILTFDDGYVDNYVYAFPLLRRYGFAGTFFVIAGFAEENKPGYLNWEQARLMQQNGMDIGCHSYTHLDLRTLGAAGLAYETAQARELLEARLEKPVRFFCYPSGRYNSQVIAALRSAGYWGAVTTEAGAQHSSGAPFTLTRVRIHGGDGAEKLAALLDYYQ